MKPIIITTKKNESIFDLAKRAIKNATANGLTMEVHYCAQSCLVYPNDVVENVIKFLKKMELIQKLNALSK